MTHPKNPNEHRIEIGNDWSITEQTPSGPLRRTLVQGAAWTVPVVAMAVATPAAAASPTPTLAFTNGPYAVAACGTLDAVTLKATTDGTAAAPAGTQVTVTLPSGLVWSDGTTGTKLLPTDGNGELVLSGIKATSAPGSKTITASAFGGNAVTSAPVAVTLSGVASYFSSGTQVSTAVADIPAGSTALGYGTYLAPNNDLYYVETVPAIPTGVLIVNGVTSADTEIHPSDHVPYIWYVANGAAAYYNSATKVSTPAPNVPAGSAAAGYGTFIAPKSDLYYYDQVGPVANNVTSSATEIHPSDLNAYIWYVSNGAAYFYRSDTKVSTAIANIPAGSSALGYGTFLAPNNDLYYVDTTTVVPTGVLIGSGVTSADTEIHPSDTVPYVWYVANGVATYYNSATKVSTPAPNVPSGTTAVGYGTFVDPNGDLFYYDQAAPVANNVTSSATEIHPSDANAYIWYAENSCA